MSGLAAEPPHAAPPAPQLMEAAVADAAARQDARPEMPLPEDARTVFLGGLFLLASLSALQAASATALPIVLALLLNLAPARSHAASATRFGTAADALVSIIMPARGRHRAPRARRHHAAVQPFCR